MAHIKMHEIIRVIHVVVCPVVFVLFDDPDWQGKSAPNYEKWSFFTIFSRLGLSPQVFGEFNEWLMLDLHKTIRVSHVVAIPIVFFYFISKIGREECS